MSTAGVLLTVAGLAARPTPVAGQPDATDDGAAAAVSTIESPTIRFDLTPGVWLPRLKNETSLSGPDLDLDDDLSLRDREATFRGELEVRKGDRWQLRLDGFHFSVRDEGTFRGAAEFGDVRLAPGDRYRAEVKLTSIGAEAAWAAVLWPGKLPDRGQLRLSPTVGLRFVDAEMTLDEIGGAREEPDGTWLATLAGVQLALDYRTGPRLPWLDRLELRAQTGIGPAFGGDGGWVWDLRADLGAFVTDRLALRFGFRLLELDVETDDWQFGGGLQGLFLAATIRF